MSAHAAQGPDRFPALLGAGLLIYALYGITSALQRLLELPSYTLSMFGCALSFLVLIASLAFARPRQTSAPAKPAASAGAGRRLLWVGVIFLGLSIILQAAAAFDAYSRGDSQTSSSTRVFVPVDSSKHKKSKKNGDKKGDKEKAGNEAGDNSAAADEGGSEKSSKKKRDTSTD